MAERNWQKETRLDMEHIDGTLCDMTATKSADPSWWRSGTFQGQNLRTALAKRDVTTVFGFLRSRGWSRSTVAAATGLSESRVREIAQGKRIVTSYDVLERIATGLRIDRELMGLGYSGAESSVPAFLAEISEAHTAGYRDFDYGTTRTLPYIPRIRDRRAILAPAR